MAGNSFGNNGPSQTVSPFPPPPEYALNYTTDNIKNFRTLKPPPVPKKFTVFGEEIDMEGKMIQSLSEMGLQQMYSSTANWKAELKKLNKSVVAAFLDLLEILIKCPDSSERREKVETIRMLFINMHHLINEYRPVQARDTLRHMMTKQNKEIKIVNEKMRNYISTSTEAFDKILATFKETNYDSNMPTAPDSNTEPLEFEKLAFKSKENDRMTVKGATKHEYICQNIVIQRHLQLLQMAENEEKYSESFSRLEFEEEEPLKTPQAELEATPSEENLDLELEEPDEFEEKSSGEIEEEPDNESSLDVPVEFMDDNDSDELMDILDESDSNMSPIQPENKEVSVSPENQNTIEYQEPPSEFVDDTTQDKPNEEILNEQPGSHSTPDNFLDQQDDIE